MQSLSEDQRLWLACGLAALLHLALMFAVRFGIEPAKSQTLEVSFVTLTDGSSALTARVLAPVTHAGGGHRRELRATPPRTTGLSAQRGDEGADREPGDTPARTGNAPSLIASSTPSATPVPDSQDAQAGATAGARLPYEETPGYGPRSADRNEAALMSSDTMPGASGISTRAHREALYRDAWRREIERVGAANFPWSELTLGKPQSLTLSVTVRADGSVYRARVLRSSGQPSLDRAAMEILRLAAPFPAFPEPLRANAAELNFSYDWEFFPGERSELRVGRP